MSGKPTPTSTKKTKRSTTRAASTTPKAAAKTTPKATVVSTKTAATAATAVSEGGASKVEGPELTKKEMVERMVANTGMKKGDARRALEASMEAVAQALREGYNLTLPPLGKIKIARTKDTPNGKMVVLRAKLKEPASAVPKAEVAEAAE